MTESQKSLTRAMYHIRTAKEYLEVFKLDLNSRGAHIVNNWTNKLNFVISDARASLEDESREHFDKEIISPNDILFFSSVGDKLYQLSDQQRLMVEDLVDSLIKNNPMELLKNKTEAA